MFSAQRYFWNQKWSNLRLWTRSHFLRELGSVTFSLMREEIWSLNGEFGWRFIQKAKNRETSHRFFRNQDSIVLVSNLRTSVSNSLWVDNIQPTAFVADIVTGIVICAFKVVLMDYFCVKWKKNWPIKPGFNAKRVQILTDVRSNVTTFGCGPVKKVRPWRLKRFPSTLSSSERQKWFWTFPRKSQSQRG